MIFCINVLCLSFKELISCQEGGTCYLRHSSIGVVYIGHKNVTQRHKNDLLNLPFLFKSQTCHRVSQKRHRKTISFKSVTECHNNVTKYCFIQKTSQSVRQFCFSSPASRRRWRWPRGRWCWRTTRTFRSSPCWTPSRCTRTSG